MIKRKAALYLRQIAGKVFLLPEPAMRSMIIRITDPELIARTGGIVQGMSGSPLIQNGKIIGAVTHVMVNDPTMGYGISIEAMLNAAETANTVYAAKAA